MWARVLRTCESSCPAVFIHVAPGATQHALTCEVDFTHEHHQRFRKLLLFFPQLSSLRLHAPPWHHEADALPTGVHGLAIFELRGRFDDVGLGVLLALGPSHIILVVLKREEEVVLVARVAEVPPDACRLHSVFVSGGHGLFAYQRGPWRRISAVQAYWFVLCKAGYMAGLCVS